MTLEERIMPDLKEAMKAKDQAALRGIRAIKSAILLVKTDGSGEEINEEKEIAILQKLIKSRKDSLEIYNQQGRKDLAVVEEEEIAIIQRYLPKQLSREEIEEVVKGIISETGASSPKDMGKVIGVANKTLAGQAEGKVIAEVVKALLNS